MIKSFRFFHLHTALIILLALPFAVGIVAARSSNAGSWTRQRSGTMTWLRSVYFLNKDTGWAVGGAGVLLRTTDGGLSWQIKRRPLEDVLWDVYFSDENNGVMLCERSIYKLQTIVEQRSYLLRTVDGGATWTRVNFPGIDTELLLVRLSFLDAMHGYAFGEGGMVFATRDGGITWNRQATSTRHLLLGASFLDTQRGWIVGGGGTILQTTDGGETWVLRLGLGIDSRLSSVTFIDERKGWAVGDGGTIIYTANGGQSWKRQTSTARADLFDVKFINASEGWAVGAEGTILHTRDGGTQWVTEPPPGITHPLGRLSVLKNSRHAWAVGFGGTILTYSPEAAPAPALKTSF